jgi:hypothetical protein
MSWNLPIVPILILTDIDDKKIIFPKDLCFNDDGILSKTFIINDKFELREIIYQFKSPNNINLDD